MHRRQRARALAVAIAALALVACGKDPAPTTPDATATVAGVSAADAAGATYTTDNTDSGTLRLVNGHYEDNDFVIAELEELQATGDLDNDGSADRAVVLSTSTGGSGTFRELYALRRVNGRLLVSEPALLGDRVVLNDLRIEHGEVVTDLVVQGANDPLCCPTQAVSYRFRLAGNVLTEISGQRRVYLKD